ncbi:MAG: lipid II flippase MurJ, partial [bacterium]
FERGGFTRADTLATSYALMAYSIGLFAYSCIKVYVPTFYALDNTRTPVRISMTAVAVNIAVNLTLIMLLPTGFKYVGLAFGTALSVTLNSTLLAISFRKAVGSLKEFELGRTFSKVLGAAFLMGCVVFLLNNLLERKWRTCGINDMHWWRSPGIRIFVMGNEKPGTGVLDQTSAERLR